jgi:hypothetical protein
VETCNEGTDSCDAGTPPACNNGDYCDGVETCNEGTDSCDPGTPINCDNGLYCDGAEVCNEATDSCGPGTPPACDNGDYCDGVESCNESTDSCDAGTAVVCDDGVGCTDDACNEASDACDSVINGVNCPDDGSFCNGAEFCDPVNDCSSTGDPCTPGTESCNETTDTCDTVSCFDNDGDGYGSPGDASCPNGAQADCDDTDAGIHPGASEICDGKDTNCDGNLPALETDADGDGHPICAGDCDDSDSTRYPGATEICDGKDNDCAGGIPFNERDNDADGVKICDVPSDCNDFDATVSPNSSEICGDGKDNNCDGTVDEAACICPDADGDGETLDVCGGTDCNDADPTIFAGATEICDDEIDNNCDGQSDCADGSCATDPNCTACAGGDLDGDTYSTVGGTCGPVDCDDTDPAVYPGASEICDGKDSNCDGYQGPTDVDADGDGHAICAGDCDDSDSTRYPGAPEICDGKDNDCAGGIPLNERDNDADGVKICDVPSDCNDFNAGISPNASEICGDGVDNNCDGTIDEAGCACPDSDGDGHTASVCGGTDCNDADPAINPAAAEVCNDEIDNDCDAQSDCNDVDCSSDTGCQTCVATDLDGDGYSTAGGTCGPIDCNDADPAINPGAAEVCDGKDNNCDGYQSSTDMDNDGDGYPICAGDCDDTDATTYPGAPELCDGKNNDCASGVPANEQDNDADGYRICENDCNDSDPTIHPGVAEDATAPANCTDGIDNDCDGLIDTSDSGCDDVCVDNDGDGYGVVDRPTCPNAGDDCDDSDPNTHPGAVELCDGGDNDCVGGVPANEADGDADTYRICDGDCDDNNINVRPGAPELCDGLDNDCVGGVPANEADGDSDTYRICDGDCDDNNINVYPGAPELCDGLDNDCVGGVPANEADGDSDTYRICDGDCDDNNINVYPGALELCDGLDNDCVGGVPANEADGDADTYRICDGDCADNDPAVNPGATEGPFGHPTCSDTKDNDCDGQADGADLACVPTCADGDGDGYGNPGDAVPTGRPRTATMPIRPSTPAPPTPIVTVSTRTAPAGPMRATS